MNSLAQRRYLLDFEWLRDARNTFDLFQRGWNNWVVAFSSDSQSRLFSVLGWDFISSAKLVIVMVGSILVFAAVVFMLAPLLLKFRSSRKHDPLLGLWQRFTRKLSKAGVVSHPSMGPMELATNASHLLKYDADGIQRIAELYMFCRYSSETANQAKLAELIRGFQPKPAPH